MGNVTADDLKKLDHHAWTALVEQVKADHPIDRIIENTGAEFRLDRAGCELRGKEHDSLVVSPHKGLYQWWSRNEKGDAITWIRNRYGVGMHEAVLMLLDSESPPVGHWSPPPVSQPAQPPTLPPDLHLRYHRALDASSRAWWHEQGVTDQGIARFWLGVCDDRDEYGRCFTIPVIEGGVLVNLRLRLLKPTDGHKDKYRPWAKGFGTQLYNADILTPELGAVVITAGEKKVMVLWEHGIPAVSPTGGCGNWRDEWTTRLQFCKHVYICFDPPEQASAWKLAERIGERALVAQCPDKPDDYLLAHGRDAFRRVLRDALPYADHSFWQKQLGGRNLWGKLI